MSTTDDLRQLTAQLVLAVHEAMLDERLRRGATWLRRRNSGP